MFVLERAPRAHAAKEHAGMADPMTLLEQLLDQRGRFAGALPPHNVVTVMDDSGEIECVELDFLRHDKQTGANCAAEESHKP